MMPKVDSSFYFFWIPAVAFVIQILFELTLPGEILSRLHSENGPHELLEFFFLVIGFLTCIAYFKFIKNKTKILNFWFGLAALCCFYVAGEEISWGQHLTDWATPEFWASVNDQQETNLHNTSSWFDQKPRLILEFSILSGVFLYPYLKRKKLLNLPKELDNLAPPLGLRFIAFIIIIPKILEKTFELFDIVLFARFSEVQELYMFYFVLLYLLILLKKTMLLEKT